MGRRRLQRPTLTTINISIQTAETISRLKGKKETQDGFMKRMLMEWQDLKEFRLDMDQVLRIKDRQIKSLEEGLKEKVQSSF